MLTALALIAPTGAQLQALPRASIPSCKHLPIQPDRRLRTASPPASCSYITAGNRLHQTITAFLFSKKQHTYLQMSSDATSPKPEEFQAAPENIHSDGAVVPTEAEAKPVEDTKPQKSVDDSEYVVTQPPKPPAYFPRGKPTPTTSGKPQGGGKPRPAPGRGDQSPEPTL
uniref:Uncharacterized protein n=1 Tax=Mycena chlorophos TaxID=658473 RepID=A0ABQ0MAL6_MYCCL|nr:predicted protein [Mycena chlorophos]